ncbi:CLUMA_CG001561, isoform A [Clunio marinus]|uniref:CLUMA_CG001561, isoform A n=1 Tax=Clunio marinus TaxID=568069 RepID=A0A1J1HK33_9DIPT|nr:CLUMA_CG001561, isoform A [Clunio marinus]
MKFLIFLLMVLMSIACSFGQGPPGMTFGKPGDGPPKNPPPNTGDDQDVHSYKLFSTADALNNKFARKIFSEFSSVY